LTGSKKTIDLAVNVIIHLILISALIVTLIPLLTVVITSFRSEADLSRGPFSFPRDIRIFGNYIDAWERGRFGIYLKNSVYLTLVSVIGSLVISTLAGYSFAKLHYPGRDICYYSLLISMMIPFQASMLPLYFILMNLKMLNSLNGVALVQIAGSIGFNVMMMRSFFVSIPESMIEAARLDGCTEPKILFHIILPNTFPAWASLIVFSTLGSWNNLIGPMMFIFSENKYPIPYALYAFQSSFLTRYDLMGAAMFISIIPIFIVYIIFQRNFTTNLLGGAIKG
jgi:raffinose/stachyose/melibiose transport system permease protein